MGGSWTAERIRMVGTAGTRRRAGRCWMPLAGAGCRGWKTLRFTYSETLGKWPIGDLAFGISFLLKRQVVGHSLGGGTAALLTYVLREQQEFACATCVAFAPAACMTWELAESGEHFITTVINGADLVPTFSAAAVDDLRSEVTASAWLNDLHHQIEQTRILSTFYRSASALGSRLPSMANAKARVAGAGAILRHILERVLAPLGQAVSTSMLTEMAVWKKLHCDILIVMMEVHLLLKTLGCRTSSVGCIYRDQRLYIYQILYCARARRESESESERLPEASEQLLGQQLPRLQE